MVFKIEAPQDAILSLSLPRSPPFSISGSVITRGSERNGKDVMGLSGVAGNNVKVNTEWGPLATLARKNDLFVDWG